jgi:hypothetical protein
MKSWLFQPKAEGSKKSVLKEKTNKDAGYEIPRGNYLSSGTQPVQCGEGQLTLRRSILPSSSVLKSTPKGHMPNQ